LIGREAGAYCPVKHPHRWHLKIRESWTISRELEAESRKQSA
jgi:hypothetical protein